MNDQKSGIFSHSARALYFSTILECNFSFFVEDKKIQICDFMTTRIVAASTAENLSKTEIKYQVCLVCAYYNFAHEPGLVVI